MTQATALKLIGLVGVALLLAGCVSRERLKIETGTAYAKGLTECAGKDEENLRLKLEVQNLNRGLQRLSGEAKAVERERDALAGKIKAYFALNCLCKHKDALR